MRTFPSRNKHIPYLRVYLRRTERAVTEDTSTSTLTLSASDSFGSQVILLLHFDTDNGPWGFFKDDSGYDHIPEFYSDRVLTATASSKYGVSSFYQNFDTTSTLVLITSSMTTVSQLVTVGAYGIAYAPDPEFNLGGGNFTLETYFKPNILTDAYTQQNGGHLHFICGNYTTVGPEYGWVIQQLNETSTVEAVTYDKWSMLLFYTYPADLSPSRVQTWDFLIAEDKSDTWVHAAIVKNGDKLYSFVAGDLIGTTPTFTLSQSLLETGSSARFTVGGTTSEEIEASLSSYTLFPCRLSLDELRVTAAARYTGPFTVPTVAFPNIVDADTATGSTTVSYGYSFTGAYSASPYDAKMQGISGGSSILYWWKMDSATFSSSSTNTFRNYGIAGPEWVLVADRTLSSILAITAGTEDSRAQSQANWGLDANSWIYAPGIEVAGPPFSIGGWFRKRSGVNGDYQRFFTTNVGGTADTQRGVDLRLMSSNRFRVGFGTNTGIANDQRLYYATDSSATFSLASGSAVFVVLTVSSANEYTAVGGIRPRMNLYIDGTEMSLSYGSGSITLAAFPVSMHSTNGRTGIGFRVEDQEQRFDLDELFFHPRVLTSTYIQELFAAGDTLWPTTQYMSFTGYSAGPVFSGFSIMNASDSDPYYSNVVLLAHLDTNFKDYSSYDLSLSAIGTVSLGSTTGQMGTGAVNLGTTSSRLIADSAAMYDFSAGPFTIEARIKFNTRNTTKRLVALKGPSNNNGWELYMDTANKFTANIFDASSSRMTMASSATYTSSTMYHVAWTRDTSYIHRLFVNGILQANTTNTYSMAYSSTSRLTLGRTEQAGLGYVGYMDEVRITRGVCRYEADFTPPTDPFPNG